MVSCSRFDRSEGPLTTGQFELQTSFTLRGCLYEVRHPTWVRYLNWMRSLQDGVLHFPKTNRLYRMDLLNQVRSYFRAGRIALRWDDFSSCKQFFWAAPPTQDWYLVYYMRVFIAITWKSAFYSIKFTSVDVYW